VTGARQGGTPVDSFDEAMTVLRSWVAEHGTAAVPTRTSYAGFGLGRWAARRRDRYRNGQLTAGQIAALEAVPGWDWGTTHEQWRQRGLEGLHAWVAEHGAGNIPRDAKVGEVNVGTWVRTQRAKHRVGRLSSHRVVALEAVAGWVWDSPRHDPWTTGIAALRDWVAATGNVGVLPVEHNGIPLRAWAATRRSRYQADTLSAEHAHTLEAIPGWVWQVRETQFADGYAILEEWAGEHGHAHPPLNVLVDDFRLGWWVGSQRKRFQEGTISPERIAALEALPGWEWAPNRDRWNTMHALLADYAQAHGHATLATKAVVAGERLGQWSSMQRVQYHDGKMRQERIQALEAVPGWQWSLRPPRAKSHPRT
jgi:Helicase associated domain